MAKEITITLSPKQASEPDSYIAIAAAKANVATTDIDLVEVVRRSIDARRGVKILLTLRLYLNREPLPQPIHFDYPDVSNGREVIVVGAGPAGLFAALRLIERGFRPIVIERGKSVSERKVDIAQINQNKEIDPDSNYAFGEGGAGAFSDGKLYTRSKKRGDYSGVLRRLVFHGADPSILYLAHPHIGSDKLPTLVSALRSTIIDAGGEFLFNTRVERIVVSGGTASGVECAGGVRVDGQAVVLATGHSARDVYHMLNREGLAIEAMPYAMGLRVEHPQSLIDSIQYRIPQRGDYLPAAAYSLVTQVGDRGVYSFCMCPGGFIVPAMTSKTECVVNGMSPSGRNSPFANSGIITQVKLDDFQHLKAEFGELAGLRYQEEFEQAARMAAGESQLAPAQRLSDFVSERPSSSLPSSSYLPGLVSSEMAHWMPSKIAEPLRAGMAEFGRKMRGFVTEQAVVVGVESRTSTPVRIPRHETTLTHPDVAMLYPTGEGAGYAGGIMSAALDGERVADAIAEALGRQ